MSIITKLAKKKEKNLLSNLFGGSISGSESESENENENDNECNSELSIHEKEEGKLEQMENREAVEEETIRFKLECEEKITIELIQRKQLGIAFQLWPAASLLADFVISNPQLLQNNASKSSEINVLELGAGLGLTGMYIYKYFSYYPDKLVINKVVLTDLPEVMPILSENISRNNLASNAFCAPLDWNNPTQALELLRIHFDLQEIEENPPVIIAADVIYWESLFLPLINTLEELCQQGCKIIISHIKRWKKDQKFFQLCRKRNLIVETLIEKIESLPHEHTGELTKQISRIYLVYCPNRSK